MGIFTSQRNLLPLISHLPRCLIFFAFFCLALLLLFEVNNFVTQTKTIVGHNLEPTPWHEFPSNTDQESKYSKATKIIRCNYLSCGGAATGNKSSPLNGEISEYSSARCPDFFRHIYRDLEPWVWSNITTSHVMEAQKLAAFRVVIVRGRMYVDFYYACVQSRAMFTIWGFLQLLRRYPGKIPDVDLMFDCMDKPTVNRTEHASKPLPLFRYCTTKEHFDIPFPDWSFWGWSEIDISPWDEEFKSIKEGSKGRSWKRKYPVAYWRGNPDVSSPLRVELLQCNHSRKWRAQIMRQDWFEAAKGGFQESKLSKQCDYRYKIYAEGYAWSVSLKYILSCGCVPLIISPEYEDFFSRGLVPKRNYFPIPPYDLCKNIKAAVEWGNKHQSEAQEIGTAAQDFMESINMDRVYDYMYHLITEYAKLQSFKPVPPSTAQEVCPESVLCFADKKQRQWLQKSVAYPSSFPPCSLPNFGFT